MRFLIQEMDTGEVIRTSGLGHSYDNRLIMRLGMRTSFYYMLSLLKMQGSMHVKSFTSDFL